MSSIKDRLAAARLPERSLQVCLRGDLVAEFETLERELQDSRKEAGRRRLGSGTGAAQIVEQMNALREQMADEMLDIRIRALPRREWQRLVTENPPREDDQADEAMGVNLEALMEVAIPACIAEPEMDESDWIALNDALSAGDYDRLLSAVWDVNRTGVDVPFSRLASLVTAELGDVLK